MNLLSLVFAGVLLLAAAAFFSWDRIEALWRSLRTWWFGLGERVVDRLRAESVVFFLRLSFRALASLALVVFGVWVWRWPQAKAQATRLRYERMAVTQRLNIRLWTEACNQLRALAYRVDADPALTVEQRMDCLGGVEPIFRASKARLERSSYLLGRIQVAEQSVPQRIWPWSTVADPLTTITARASAGAGAIQPYVLSRLSQEATQQRWAELVVATSQPGAEALPTPEEWEGL